jgi:hypothetical protein
MSRIQTALLLLTLTLIGACGDNDEPPTAPTPPTLIESTVEGRVTPHGAQSFVFTVTRQGQITARIASLEPDVGGFIGLSLGTWTPNACQILLANDAAQVNTTLVGTATSVGTFCLRLYDVGHLTEPIDFVVELSHF